MSQRGGKSKSKRKRKAARKAGPQAQIAVPPAPVAVPPAPVPVAQTEPVPPFGGDSLLEQSRTRWQYGDWDALASTAPEVIAADPDRAKVAILVAAAHAQQGAQPMARRYAAQALDWGLPRRIAAQVLVAAVHNSLARTSVALDLEDEAQSHFDAALRLVEPRADVALLAQTRRIRETARMGLLPQAGAVFDGLVSQIAADHRLPSPDTVVLRRQVDLLRQMVSVAQSRGQLGPGAGLSDDIAARATSQLGQDLWVLDQTRHKRDGFFVELGASDGVLFSNTLMLERDYGWTGLCTEPNPALFDKLQRNRSCIVLPDCIGARSGQKGEFILAEEDSSLAEHAGTEGYAARRAASRDAGQVVTLTTVSLHDFLTRQGAPHSIDYLSLNTQGSDYEILENFPFEAWNIRCLTVGDRSTPQRDKIRALLARQGYVHAGGADLDWYVRPDIVVIAGVPRSGSTWLFNAARHLAMADGRQVYGAWVEDYAPRDHLEADLHLIKLHFPHQLSFVPHRLLTTQRDLAERLASLVRMGWLAQEAGVLRAEAETQAKLYAYWAERSDAEIAYTDLVTRPEQAVMQVAQALGLPCDATRAGQVAQALVAMGADKGARDADTKEYDKVTLLHPGHRASADQRRALIDWVRRVLADPA